VRDSIAPETISRQIRGDAEQQVAPVVVGVECAAP
jgi:hypothetical protein